MRAIAGRVTFADGCAARPLRVRLQGYSPLNGSRGETITAADGSFALSGLAPATLYLQVQEVTSVILLTPLSARFGDREISGGGFDYPLASDAPLEITVGCDAQGRLR